MDVLTTIWDFLNQDSPKGNNTPTGNEVRITQDGKVRITSDGKIRIISKT